MKFDYKNYRSFFDLFFDSFGTNNYILISIGTSLGIYIFCLIIALIGGILSQFIFTYQIYLHIFGYIWVSSWLRWGYFRTFYYLNTLPLNFEGKGGEKLYKKLENQLKNGTNNYYIIISTL